MHENLSFTPRLRWQHGLGAMASETVFGLDYYTGRIAAASTTFAGQHADQTSSAFYFQNSTALAADWNLTLGGRTQRMKQNAFQGAFPAFGYDEIKDSAANTRHAYDLGLAYSRDGWRAYGKVGTTFRFANTDELFGYDNVTGNPIFAGNLKPQHGVIQELGGAYRNDSLSSRLSLYRLELKDEIGYDANSGLFGNNVNYDPTRRQGLEAEADWRFSPSWRTRLAYAYTQAQFTDGPYANKSVPLVPRHKATAELLWKSGNASYGAVANYTGSRLYSGDLSNQHPKLGGHTTLDLQGSWQLGTWALSAKVVNALDKRYANVAGYSAFKADYYYYPSDARSLFFSARYNFQ